MNAFSKNRQVARPAEYADMPDAEYNELAKRNIENTNLIRRDHESSAVGPSMAIIAIGYVVTYFHLGRLVGVMDFNGPPIGYILGKDAKSKTMVPTRLLTRWLSGEGEVVPRPIAPLDSVIEHVKRDMVFPFPEGKKFTFIEMSAAELQEMGWQIIKHDVAVALTNPAEAVTMTASSTKENQYETF